MKKILIVPFSNKYPDRENAKNYPFWKDLILILNETKNYEIIQIGLEHEEQLVPTFYKNLPPKELKNLLDSVDLWVSVDSFFPHFAVYYNRPGIVIFGPSDPLIFGHKENINLLKDRLYLRPDQFGMWSYAEFNIDAFVSPIEVFRAIEEFKINGNI